MRLSDDISFSILICTTETNGIFRMHQIATFLWLFTAKEYKNAKVTFLPSDKFNFLQFMNSIATKEWIFDRPRSDLQELSISIRKPNSSDTYFALMKFRRANVIISISLTVRYSDMKEKIFRFIPPISLACDYLLLEIVDNHRRYCGFSAVVLLVKTVSKLIC